MTDPTPDVPTLRRLLAEATPGPWEEAIDDHGRKGVDVGIWSPSAIRYPVESLVPGNPNHRADAALIVAAVNALPGILDDRDRMLATDFEAVLATHIARDCHRDDGESVGTECTCGEWAGDYFADGEAGPFDAHLATALRAALAEVTP